MGHSFVPFAATGVALILLAGGIGGAFPVAAEVLLSCAAAFFVASVCVGFSEVRKRRDPYSLEALRSLHEDGEPAEEEVADEFDSVVCRCCGTVYSDRISVCPRCGSM